MTRRGRRGFVAVIAALVLVLAGINEGMMLFPLTPIWLDRSGAITLPAADRLRVALTGDILLDDAARSTLERRGLDWPFAATARLLSGADLVVGNLEGPISPHGTPEDSRWSYNMPIGAAAALHRARIRTVSLGNNHVRDCGDLGVRESLASLREAGVAAFGAGVTEEEAGRPLVQEVKGLRIAFAGYLAPSQLLDGKFFPLDHLAARGQWGVALAEPARLRTDLGLARRQADVVVAVMHLGDRYQAGPTEDERRVARDAIDAGADAVVGHGPHVLGPIELYRGRPILYSIGNYAFGSGNLRARFSALAFVEIATGATPKLQRIELVPIFTSNRTPWVRYQAKVLVGWKARRVLEDLRRRSPTAAAKMSVETGPVRLRVDLH